MLVCQHWKNFWKVGGDNVDDDNVEGAFETAFPTINIFFSHNLFQSSFRF